MRHVRRMTLAERIRSYVPQHDHVLPVPVVRTAVSRRVRIREEAIPNASYRVWYFDPGWEPAYSPDTALARISGQEGRP